MRLLPFLAAFALCVAKPTFQDELRAKAGRPTAPREAQPPSPSNAFGGGGAAPARGGGAPLAAAAAPPGSPFVLPSDDASLRQRVAQAFADVARQVHGDGEGVAMTGADLPGVLAAVFNPAATALSGDEEAEMARLCGRWVVRAGFGGEVGAAKPLPLAILQQHSATGFLREAAPRLLAIRAQARAAAKEAAERELAGEPAAEGGGAPPV